jgi:hypothetical protein
VTRPGDAKPKRAPTIPEGAVMRMALSSWDHFEANSPVPFPIKVKGPEGSIGFCEVFESLEAGIKVYGPSERFMPIQQGPPRKIARRVGRKGGKG